MKNLLKLTISLQLFIILILPVFVFAQAGDPPADPNSYKIQIPSFLNPDVTDVESLIYVIINDIVIPIGSVVAVLMIMWAGWLYVTSAGNPANITKAKDALINASIGAAILLGAKLIAEVVQTTVKQL
jgi:hypothetical protein